MLDAYLAAVRDGDDAALAACYAEDCVWLTAEGPRHGRDAAMARHRELRDRMPGLVRVGWDRIEQQGAHAALWWTGRDEAGTAVARGMALMEIRAGAVRLKADHVVPAT